MTRTPKEAVLGLWRTLSARDYDGIADWVTDVCIYLDVPVGPTLAARGPADIAKRLRVGWGGLAAYENHDGLLVADGDDVMYEHSETWGWTTGEKAVLRFVSVHRVENGKVTIWKDYWDMSGLTATAPPTWMEELASADTSWIFDATGLI